MLQSPHPRLAALLLLLLAPLPAAAVWPPPRDPAARWVETRDASPQPDVRPDALVVKMRRRADGLAAAQALPGLLADQPIDRVEPLFARPGRGPRAAAATAEVLRVSFRRPVDVQALSRRLALDPGVEYAEPVLRVRAAAPTNDPYLSSSGAWGQAYQDLWGLHTIGAPAAWDATTGQGVVVAVVDTGSDLAHPDLAANLWQNPGEVAGNFLDDDGNGFVDDIHGWDFANGDAVPFDDQGHGTHVAGTIAAVANNGTGVVGVAWGAKVMSVKGLDQFGSGWTDDLAEGIVYAAENGARVVNMSWGGFGTSQVVEDALAVAYDAGVVLVAAAGNSNMDASQFHPASSRYVLCVGASSPDDLRVWFSNFGASVDVLAPGGVGFNDGGGPNVLSLRSSLLWPGFGSHLYVGDRYLRLQGTSMAAPHAAGLAALLLEEHPGLTPEELRQVVRRSAADVVYAGWDWESGYGRIAAGAAVAGAAVRGSARLLAPAAREVLSSLGAEVRGTATAPAFSSWTLERGRGVMPTDWTLLASSPSPVVAGHLADLDPLALRDDVYTLRLTTRDALGSSFEDRLEVVVDNVRFTAPEPRAIFRGGDLIVFSGWSATPDFSHYTLEYLDMGVWKSDGMLLTGGGLAPVHDGVLGTWDTSVVTRADYYRVRLLVFRQDGTIDFDEREVGLDPSLHPGWPRAIANVADGSFSLAMLNNTTAADVDGDGTFELLYAQAEQVHVFRHDGSYLPGWPRLLPFGHQAQRGAAAGDLDGDGTLEIVVLSTAYQGIFVFDHDGTVAGPLPQRAYTAAIGDVLGDSRPELVLCGPPDASGLNVWVVDRHGNVLAPPYRLERLAAGDPPWPSQPVLTDLDGDGKLDIVVANTNQALELHAFRGNSLALPGFPLALGVSSEMFSPFEPAAADLDGDGWTEIVAGNSSCATFAVSRTGQVLPGWPFTPAEPLGSCGPPTLSDLDHDGRPEIVLGAAAPWPETSRLLALDRHGQLLPNWPVSWTANHLFYGAGAAAAVDVDGDGRRDLVADGEMQPFALRGYDADGGLLAGFPKLTGAIGPFDGNTPAILDLDDDGLLEIAWLSFRGEVFVWDTPAPARVTPLDWPMLRHDPGHTGALPPADCSVATGALDFYTVAPCRVVDTRSVLGGPALASGVPRLVPIGGACGVPPTAKAVVANVTVTGPSAQGHLGFGLGSCPFAPGASTINFSTAQTRANFAILPLAPDVSGTAAIFPFVLAGGSVHLILDVTGYFE